MAGVTNNWSLFGLDLTRSGAWLSLGVRQLLYDRGAWLAKRFDPAVNVMSGKESTVYQADLPVTVAIDEPVAFNAVALPPSDVLLKTFWLPASAEEDLSAAMTLEAGLSSPFAEADTRASWRVMGRANKMIEVVLAITAQQVIDNALTDFRDLELEGGSSAPEIWAFSEAGVPIPFSEYGGGKRKSSYHRHLTKAALLVISVWLSVMLGLIVFAGAAAIRAERLDSVLQEVRIKSSAAAEQRELLQLGRTRLSVIENAAATRPNYQYWLHHISASAPDTVYFDRLNFEGTEVTVNGYSDNASVYLRMLTEEQGYTDVTALSAFSRDRNNGLERFSIQWRLTDVPQPEIEPDSTDETAAVEHRLEAGL